MSESKKVIKSAADVASELISQIFQLKRLDELAKQSAVVSMAHAEAIMLANYVILAQSEIQLEQLEVFGITITAKTFQPNFQGKLDALALCFGHCAGKIDQAINIMAASQILGNLDFIRDITMAALTHTIPR